MNMEDKKVVDILQVIMIMTDDLPTEEKQKVWKRLAEKLSSQSPPVRAKKGNEGGGMNNHEASFQMSSQNESNSMENNSPPFGVT